MSQFSCATCGLPRDGSNGSRHDTPEACIQALRGQVADPRQHLQEIKTTLETAGTPDFDVDLSFNGLPERLFQFMQGNALWKQDEARVLKEKAQLQEENRELRAELVRLRADQEKAL